MSQIDTENDKNPQTFQFSKVLCIVFQFLTDFVEWNIEKSWKRRNVLSSRLFQRVYCNSLSEKKLKVTPKKMKNTKLIKFQSFYAFFVKVSTDLVDCNKVKGQQRKSWLSSSSN